VNSILNAEVKQVPFGGFEIESLLVENSEEFAVTVQQAAILFKEFFGNG